MKILNIKSLFLILFIGACPFVAAQKTKIKSEKIDEALLLSVFDSTAIKKSVIEIEPHLLNKTRHVRILTDKSYELTRGKLISYNKYGLFVYEKSLKRLGFYPYKNIKKVKIGRSYGNFNIILSSVGGVLTGFAMAADIDPLFFPVGVIIGSGVTAFYTQIFVGPLYGIYKVVYKLNWNLKEKETSIVQFYNYLKDNPAEIQFVNEFIVDQNSGSIHQPENQSAVTTNHENINSDSTSLVSNPVETTNQEGKIFEKRKFLEGQSFGDGNNMNAKWIFVDFNSSKLNESELQSVFKNIRGMQINRGQLSKYNTSQLQFLAMMICSGGGFDMKSVVSLTENQRKFIGMYESGYLEVVKIDGTLSTMNLSDIDLDNLKVIYGELRERTQ